MRFSAHCHVAVWLAALSALAYLAYSATSARPAGPRHSAAREPIVVEERIPPAPAARPPSAPPADAPVLVPPAQAFDERGLMTELRSLRLADPEQALQRATRANVAHPSSVGAPERAWIAVRCLEDLRRFHEARDAARSMQRSYPGTSWTDEVERHVLIHPLDLPSREEQQARLQRASR